MKPLVSSQSFLLIMLLAAAQMPGQVDMIAHEECGVEFWIPTDWAHELEQDLLIVRDPDATLQLYFLTSGIQVPEQFSDALLNEISKVISHPEVASVSQQGEHNDLIYYDAHGFGLFQKEIVDWELRFVAGARKSLMVIAIGDLETHRQTVEQIHDTIQLTKIEAPEELADQ